MSTMIGVKMSDIRPELDEDGQQALYESFALIVRMFSLEQGYKTSKPMMDGAMTQAIYQRTMHGEFDEVRALTDTMSIVEDDDGLKTLEVAGPDGFSTRWAPARFGQGIKAARFIFRHGELVGRIMSTVNPEEGTIEESLETLAGSEQVDEIEEIFVRWRDELQEEWDNTVYYEQKSKAEEEGEEFDSDEAERTWLGQNFYNRLGRCPDEHQEMVDEARKEVNKTTMPIVLQWIDAFDPTTWEKFSPEERAERGKRFMELFDGFLAFCHLDLGISPDESIRRIMVAVQMPVEAKREAALPVEKIKAEIVSHLETK